MLVVDRIDQLDRLVGRVEEIAFYGSERFNGDFDLMLLQRRHDFT